MINFSILHMFDFELVILRHEIANNLCDCVDFKSIDQSNFQNA